MQIEFKNDFQRNNRRELGIAKTVIDYIDKNLKFINMASSNPKNM